MGRSDGYLRWVKTLLQAPVSRRKEWVDSILDGFREYRKKKNPDKTEVYLSDALEAGHDYELVGFIPKVEYIKVEGKASELNCIWEHPHMNPNLLYKHKRLPVFIITGPGLRFNESVLNEVGMNSTGVRGITG